MPMAFAEMELRSKVLFAADLTVATACITNSDACCSCRCSDTHNCRGIPAPAAEFSERASTKLLPLATSSPDFRGHIRSGQPQNGDP
jgi:hypothetical protein